MEVAMLNAKQTNRALGLFIVELEQDVAQIVVGGSLKAAAGGPGEVTTLAVGEENGSTSLAVGEETGSTYTSGEEAAFPVAL
jgi:hypothetical protein